MYSIEEQLARYKSVHLNPLNIKTHFVGIPFIVLAVTLLFSSIIIDIKADDLLGPNTYLHITLAMIAFVPVAIYYLILHRLLAMSMVIYILLNLYIAHLLNNYEATLNIALGLFIIGWVLQFIGHYYEKAKPAFIDDLSQALIGPLFLMAEVYFYLGFCQKLQADVTSLAIEKRQVIDKLRHK